MRKVLYKELPPIYRQRDKDRQLERYFRVLGGGLNKAQSKIDSLFHLFDVRNQNEEILDILAENLGFKFPPNFTLQEKRLFIYNLPNLLKIKGEDNMYELLAHIFFHEDARVSVEWEYLDGEGYSTRNVVMGLDVPDTIEDFDAKREKFEKLVDYFRVINVGISWNVILFYKYIIKMKVSYRTFDYIEMEDNFDGKMSEEEAEELLNEGDIPFHLSGPKGFPPELGNLETFYKVKDFVLERTYTEDIFSNPSYKYSNEVVFKSETEGIEISSTYTEFSELDELIKELLQKKVEDNLWDDKILWDLAEENKSQVGYFDTHELSEETSEEVVGKVTYINVDYVEKDDVLLNKGTLNSTLILNGERKEI